MFQPLIRAIIRIYRKLRVEKLTTATRIKSVVCWLYIRTFFIKFGTAVRVFFPNFSRKLLATH